MKASSENVNGYMREVDELALFEVEPDEIPSTLTGFSKNSILVGRENEEICRLDKNGIAEMDGSSVSQGQLQFQ